MTIRPFQRRGAAAPSADPLALSQRLANALPGHYGTADRARDFRTLFREMPAGRRVLAQVLARCRVLDRAYVPGDAAETARREGMRDVGLWLLEILGEDGTAPAATAEAEPQPERRGGRR
jgi:hypothetical protein